MRPTFAEVTPGTIETGLAASLTSVESNTRGTLSLSAARFEKLREILWTFELGLSYHHQNSLDQLDVEVALGFAKPLASGFYPYVSFAVGRRASWVGSFNQSQLTLGPSFGFRQLIGSRAGIRTEYRFRRVKSSSTANYSEQSLQIGVSLFWNNGS
ncbi:MAG: hypothetical protein HKN21_17640 [Candidatus Eisenbacteria bacterium]|uniref:Outer membrane protein beta-barrel domain-containing protein n=1 Tax=Eiseniibacteriota bacterium TaxID=2212470 RepID=A0A7Y2EET1_UNCEI|nr:hypothetical protein [Candidatus Eisenbacteria bacterium]